MNTSDEVREGREYDASVVKAADAATADAATTAGQRKVNLIWEFTQSIIAISIVLANVILGVAQGISERPGVEHPDVLSSMAFLVLGFYFARTNHQAIGGIGRKPEQPYQGR